jgi:hydroxymethylpyrimidine pyrophosphatase-like HAD family hydrolase
MFKAAGLSIAMGNASKEVQAEADAVTDTNEAEGFANAVRRILAEQ